jgi:hypothetical protein
MAQRAIVPDELQRLARHDDSASPMRSASSVAGSAPCRYPTFAITALAENATADASTQNAPHQASRRRARTDGRSGSPIVGEAAGTD